MGLWKPREPDTSLENLLKIMERLTNVAKDCSSRAKADSILKGNYDAQAAEYAAIAKIIQERIEDGQATQALAETLAPPQSLLRRSSQPSHVPVHPELEGHPDEARLVAVTKPSSGIAGKIAQLFGTTLYKEKPH